MHIHVQGPDGEAKFWIEPAIELARNESLREKDLNKVRRAIEEHEDEIRTAWNRHFSSRSD